MELCKYVSRARFRTRRKLFEGIDGFDANNFIFTILQSDNLNYFKGKSLDIDTQKKKSSNNLSYGATDHRRSPYVILKIYIGSIPVLYS